jgi:glycosyltransferase involved in cell wall biosynthesis
MQFLMNRRLLSIAYFTNTDVRAGVEEHILTLLRGLDRQRFRPYLICPPALIELMQADIPADVEILPLNLVKPTQFGAAWRLASFLRAERIDVLHSHMFRSSLFASPVGWFCHVPLIVETVHGREDWRRGWLKSRFVVDRAAGRFVDAYISVSTGCAEYLVNRKGLPAGKIHVIPNGCDLDRFTGWSGKPPAMKDALGFRDGQPVLVVVGRLEPQKGHAVLLEALVKIRDEFADVHLVCVGEGSLTDSLKAQTSRLGLTGQVHFAGYQRNTEDWLAMADIAVLPSFYEGMPLAAIEALAAGRAIVATAVDGTSEVVVDGKTGLTVPPGDAGALAEAICRLLRNPDQRRTFGAAGRQWVLEKFSEKMQLRRTQELYLSVLSKRRSMSTEGVDEKPGEPATV